MLDLKGLSCPEPVIEVRKHLKNTDNLTVIVDNVCSKENVCRYAKAMSFTSQVTKDDNENYIIELSKA